MVLLRQGNYSLESIELATGYQFPLKAGINIVYHNTTKGTKTYIGQLHFDDNEVEILLTLNPDAQAYYHLNDFWDIVQRGTNVLNALI